MDRIVNDNCPTEITAQSGQVLDVYVRMHLQTVVPVEPVVEVVALGVDQLQTGIGIRLLKQSTAR